MLGLKIQANLKYDEHYVIGAKNKVLNYFQSNYHLNAHFKTTLMKSLVKSKLNHAILCYMNMTRIGKMETLDNQMVNWFFRCIAHQICCTREHYCSGRLSEVMFMKMVVLFQKFKKLRKDHELHSIVDNDHLVGYWQKFNLTTKKIINKYQNFIPWGIDYLSISN